MTAFQAPVRAERLLESLTDEQRAVVETDAARVRVIAPPGSGKTRVLAARVVWLVRVLGHNPSQIRVFVFTRAAAAELRARVASVLGGEVAQLVDVTTFHGYAARLCAARLEEFGEIATDELADAALRSLYEGPLRVPARKVPGIEAVRDAIVRREAGATLEGPAAHAVRLVLSRLQGSGAWPMWGLLPDAAALLDDVAVAADEAVDHLLVDEAQDVTPRESAMVRRLADAGSSRVMAVGDPRQAIFGFRGADPAALDWIGGEAATLTRSFRFGPEIAARANDILLGDWPAVVGCGEPGDNVEVEQDMYVWIDRLRAHLGGMTFDGELRHKTAAVLCRQHCVCETAVAMLGPGFVHIDKDRHEGDPFDAAARAGLVPVATIHAAKGREWDVVAIPPHANFPDGSLDDLRTLFVALTRARRTLIVGALRGQA